MILWTRENAYLWLRTHIFRAHTLVWLCYAGLVLPQIFLYPPFAQDDLLRNVVAYAWDFDYRQLYAQSRMPVFDPYLGFDWLLGLLSRALSPTCAMHFAQLAGTAVLLVTIAMPLRKFADASFRIAVAILLVTATLTTSRLVGGRPELWATAWLLSAAVLPARTWLIAGAVLSPAYWLLPLYAVGGFLVKGSWLKRFSYVAAGAIVPSIFWLCYAKLSWVKEIRAIPKMAALRPSVPPEAAPLAYLLHYPGTWLLLGAMLLTALALRSRLRDPRWWAAAAFFLAVGSARHMLVYAPLAALWVTHQRWGKAGAGAWSGLALLAIVSGLLTMSQLPVELGPRFELAKGSEVLTGYQLGVFSLPFHNPGKITMAPSIESAWDPARVQELALGVGRGTLTCQQLSGTTFTHVVGRTSMPLRLACLEPVQAADGWQLYRLVSK